MPKPFGALANYIAADSEFRGIGPALAARLANRFGRYLRDALAGRDPGVIEILGHDLAETTFAAFDVKAQEADLLDWLERNGVVEAVGVQTAIRVARCWGGEGVEALRENPYLLTAFLPWRRVEQIATALGIAPDDPRRAVAAVEAVLYAALDRNDTFAAERDVEAGVAKLLNSAATPAGHPALSAIDAAVESGGACRLGDGLQPFGAAVMEEFIARTITDCLRSEPYHDLVVPKPDPKLVEARIEVFDAGQLHPLTERQKTAIQTALSQRVMVLAGYAGSGKTTSLRGICDLAESFGRSLHLMALSGRAAQRMAVATSRPARTIAGFLQSMARSDAETLPPGAMVIVDEASMLDLPTLWRILKVLGDANLMLVGDPAQLPPIGFGLTFHVLCQTERIPHVVLDRVLRQPDASGIPSVAEAVRLGKPPALATYEGIRPGVSFIPTAPEDAIGVISGIGRDMRSSSADPGDTQIIAPVKAGPAGIDAINSHFHALRRQATDGTLFPGRSDIAEGDPIIWTRNDWDRELMNGSMGRVQSVIDGIAHVTIDGKPFELDAADADNLDLAYAISVHKAQGSQWRRVIIPVFPSRLLDRTLIYTAITRATEQVIILGDRRALAAAIENTPASTARSVGLDKRLRQAYGFSSYTDYVPEAMEV
ncbi:ATP-dependent RecD-like DNA helicase [Cereibacter azotoformans]|uniref:Exodeoxyribonuclease V alpha subunit n=1 Tax=Cereibacter azotoformans TaxID=43057 RepID=A0A2T5JKC5_9RHOB|nr:AAA family ATPase [Cereibacter azotoformans]AXQ95405.1 hypothetical protein D0Z66_16380 [Cereibacter sphaeroides]PTR06944.1 exodeoxyribonuclease V alpha subunit [Cereibacter azotoformans]UIJ32364.1 ATP-dependent RecD-like DNA helicase [Cereibacter azotoformans]